MRDLIRIGATCDHPLLHPVLRAGLAQMAVEQGLAVALRVRPTFPSLRFILIPFAGSDELPARE